MNSTNVDNSATDISGYLPIIYLAVGLVGNILIGVFGLNERKRNKKNKNMMLQIIDVLTNRVDDVRSQVSQLTDRTAIGNPPYPTADDVSLDELRSSNLETITEMVADYPNQEFRIPLDSTREIIIKPKEITEAQKKYFQKS